MPIINGVWVLTDYIHEIEITRSPLLSSNKLRGVVAMTLKGKGAADSINVGVSWNNHEGTEFTLYFIEGHGQNSVKISLPDYDNKANFYELGYEVVNKDTCLFLYHYSSISQLLDKRQFTRVEVSGDGSDVAEGIQQAVNNKLISPEYRLAGNNNTAVRFTKEGLVSGLADFKQYYIHTDFLGGPENNLDEMIFDVDSGRMKNYELRLAGDTICLYETSEDDEHVMLKRGRLKYTLIKH